MTETRLAEPQRDGLLSYLNWGTLWLFLAVLSAVWYFGAGFSTLFAAWQTPEYSHGPLIPILSFLLFLRHLRDVPIRIGPLPGRWPGVLTIIAAVLLGAAGLMSGIGDIVAYSLILWVGGLLLISFGWAEGWKFWPSVLHLVYMLPLPGVLYYKLSAWLQLVSSDIGVALLRMMGVPVFLDGNIIDMGVYTLQVAEACSGLRYLFPILSFSYIFAILYTGPKWHKAVLLLAAAPITVFMNSVRIAIAGLIVQYWGLAHLEGFSHFFEGWVIFILSIILLFLLARLLMILSFHRDGMHREALDLDLTGMLPQLARVRYVYPSYAIVAAALIPLLAGLALSAMPERGATPVDRDPFALFPTEIGAWQMGPPTRLSDRMTRALAADDYQMVDMYRSGDPAAVQFFSAWYADQSKGGVHSPEICLPGAGWEISALERRDIGPELGIDTPFRINRAIIQKGMTRQIVYYWFDQRGRKVAWDFAAKAYLLVDGVSTGRTDGALVRLTTVIQPGESDAAAEDRVRSALTELLPVLPRFLTGD